MKKDTIVKTLKVLYGEELDDEIINAVLSNKNLMCEDCIKKNIGEQIGSGLIEEVKKRVKKTSAKDIMKVLSISLPIIYAVAQLNNKGSRKVFDTNRDYSIPSQSHDGFFDTQYISHPETGLPMKASYMNKINRLVTGGNVAIHPEIDKRVINLTDDVIKNPIKYIAFLGSLGLLSKGLLDAYNKISKEQKKKKEQVDKAKNESNNFLEYVANLQKQNAFVK